MEKLIELFFSNIFVVIIVITGIVKFFNKFTLTDVNGNGQKPFKEAKKFNLFDFDLEKWLEEQSGQRRNTPNGIPNTKKQTSQSNINSNISTDFGPTDLQTSIMNDGSKLNKPFNQTINPIEDDTSKQFGIDLSDLQRAVVMAEVLGPPRAKRKTFRF